MADLMLPRYLAHFDQPDTVEVTLSYAIIRLLSEQLYQSPLKALEELVVNSFDADASVCRLFVPQNQEVPYIAVFDNGHGMDAEGLADLWQIGHSNKRDIEVARRSKRKQIGKFGIGKLATYTIANQLTYITKKGHLVLGVTIDYTLFDLERRGASQSETRLGESAAEPKTIKLSVYQIDDWDSFGRFIAPVLDSLGMTPDELERISSWTLAILENLKEKGRNIDYGRLHWVLQTAMPRRSDFQLFLNNEPVISSKSNYEVAVQFKITDLPQRRLEVLSQKTGDTWYVEGDFLKSETLFREGVTGEIAVTTRTLTGKSDDLGRSHGFFVRVRERLVNENDPLFGLKPFVYDTFNRLDAQIQADDLDVAIVASRDSIEIATRITESFRYLLEQVFQEADSRYKRSQKERSAGKREGTKEMVWPRLVEHPLADALIVQKYDARGAEADESWFYLDIPLETDVDQIVKQLYTEPRSKYQYQYLEDKATNRVVRFNPKDSTFWLNESHEFVQEYADEIRTRQLLQDFVTAEALLEVYLREAQISPHIIGRVLERRDELLRSLARDRSYSFAAIAKRLRESAEDEDELEINLVVAMRALGFTANQISGADEPDGLARYIDYPGGERKLTLEAKSSASVPDLNTIDFAGLRSHMSSYEATGCLLLAPSYPGLSRGDNSQASRRAKAEKISCWTVEQLARFVELAEKRHFNARHIIAIVESAFAPEDVERAVAQQIAEPTWDSTLLYRAILNALASLQTQLVDQPRTVELIMPRVADQIGLGDVRGADIAKALAELAASSQGAMTIIDSNIRIHVSQDELERRLAGLTKSENIAPRRQSTFRKQ